MGDKETVTLTFIANFEVDPEKIDLRRNDIRSQLVPAAIGGTGHAQEILGTNEEELERIRQKIKEAKHSE